MIFYTWEDADKMTLTLKFLIGEADVASFSCYPMPSALAGGAFTKEMQHKTVHEM
jgi:hypothetical protein